MILLLAFMKHNPSIFVQILTIYCILNYLKLKYIFVITILICFISRLENKKKYIQKIIKIQLIKIISFLWLMFRVDLLRLSNPDQVYI